jgi:hypothetical protein
LSRHMRESSLLPKSKIRCKNLDAKNMCLWGEIRPSKIEAISIHSIFQKHPS